MRIITNTDINNLILYSKENLGIYKLIYKKYKMIYWCSITLIILSFILLITYILLSSLHIKQLFAKISCICCFLTSIFSLFLLYMLDKKTKKEHRKIQNYRLASLKKYYREKNYLINDIEIINELLNKRIERIEKQKITILIVIGVLILPIWDAFVQNYFSEFSFRHLAKIVLFSIFISFIVIIIIKIYNKGLYLFEENIYTKNNITLIENLIYLNTYILREKVVQKNHGGR